MGLTRSSTTTILGNIMSDHLLMPLTLPIVVLFLAHLLETEVLFARTSCRLRKSESGVFARMKVAADAIIHTTFYPN